MNQKVDRVIQELLFELAKANAKHGPMPDDTVHAAAILAEEAGEALKASLEFVYENGSDSEIRKEAIQTGAMAIKLVLYLDRKFEEALDQECAEDPKETIIDTDREARKLEEGEKQAPYLFAIPAGATVTHCRSCAARIVWIKTESGKNMPVNAEGDPTSHFATCPDANRWRKK